MNEQAIRVAAFLAATLPAFIYLAYFAVYTRQRVITHNIGTAFSFGACIAFPIVVLVWLVKTTIGMPDSTPLGHALSEAYLAAAVPEELAKFLTMQVLLRSHISATQLPPTQTIILSIAVSCGFAGLENVFYVIESDDWGSIAILRSLSAVPGHAFTGAIMGYCIAKSTEKNKPSLWFLLALVIPITLHGAYNFPLEAAEAAVSSTINVEYSTLFLIAVLTEGVLAHYLLSRHATGKHFQQDDTAVPASKIIETAVSHPSLWLGLTAACVGTSILVLTNTITPENRIDEEFLPVFAVFSLFHAAAFLVLVHRIRATPSA